jgi:hypothetical protein
MFYVLEVIPPKQKQPTLEIQINAVAVQLAYEVHEAATLLQLSALNGSPTRTIFPDPQSLICPSWQETYFALAQKFSLNASPKSNLQLPPSCPARGALAIVTNVGTGCGGRGSVGRARGRRAVFRERSDGAKTNGA